jgi:uncharacterized protein (DUF302 family)
MLLKATFSYRSDKAHGLHEGCIRLYALGAHLPHGFRNALTRAETWLFGGLMNDKLGMGIVRLRCRSGFLDTVKRLMAALQRRYLTLLAEIDHSGDAASVDLRMPATRLFIFGNPVAGTPLMLSAPSTALDLPLKALVYEDGEAVWIAYNTPEYLQQRHGFPNALLKNISGIREICEEAA